jgi:SAM-dependent methyltransferase
MNIAQKIVHKLGFSDPNLLFTGHYDEWRAKRIAAIIGHYGSSFFLKKTLLEVGCGYGDIGNVFSKLGAEVTCSEARPHHLKVIRRRYPEVSVVQADLDSEWPFKEFDIVIHMGVLYHLSSYIEPIKNACRSCRHMILETEVSDSDDPTYAPLVKEGGFDQALNGTGIRPSADAIEAVLRDCGMRYERVTDDRCNSGIHRYDWPVTNSKTWVSGLRRFWFVEKI